MLPRRANVFGSFFKKNNTGLMFLDLFLKKNRVVWEASMDEIGVELRRG
jgi:hypothetical protein